MSTARPRVYMRGLMVHANAPNKTEGVAEKNKKFTYTVRTLNLTIAFAEKSGADDIYEKKCPDWSNPDLSTS